jgi:hypothetical protein
MCASECHCVLRYIEVLSADIWTLWIGWCAFYQFCSQLNSSESIAFILPDASCLGTDSTCIPPRDFLGINVAIMGIWHTGIGLSVSLTDSMSHVPLNFENMVFIQIHTTSSTLLSSVLTLLLVSEHFQTRAPIFHSTTGPSVIAFVLIP